MDIVKIQDPKLWDCNSCLYDSFELRSFQQTLDSAVTNTRCLSMPRLSNPDIHYPVIVNPAPRRHCSSKVLRSMHKLIRTVFRLKSPRKRMEIEVYGGYLSSDGLTTIPEGCEKGVESPPEYDREVRKTFSERYTSSSGIQSALASQVHDL